MKPRRIPALLWLVWIILGLATVFAVFSQHWSNLFVTFVALLLTILPIVFSDRYKIRLPNTFLVGIALFVFGTLFLGEIFDFYE